MARVAIIGAGPGGLVAARYLRAHGFACTIFEQSGDIGGQWNARGDHSGVWPDMRTNTSRVLTCFSDLTHEPGTATYPTNQEIVAYLKRYAIAFGVDQCIRLNTRVEAVERSPGGYIVRSSSANSATATENFDRVVIASGRFNHPVTPEVWGLQSFSGSGGVVHAFRYKNPEHYRGRRVLVAGCAISALEIASDLAMFGAARVVSAYRRQRYVLPKLFAGVPTDHIAFTRFGALCAEVFPPERAAQDLKQLALRSNGSPEHFGAFKPADDLAVAGITLSQYFLPLVAEGRITVKPWIASIDGQRITFTDGTHADFDAIIFATGYELSLPFLSVDIRQALGADATHIDLFHFTFHPELPGLAFLGMYDQSGPYFPVLELQARWIAYLWAGVSRQPSAEDMAEGVRAYRAKRGLPQKQAMHNLAVLFARNAGVEPSLDAHPDLKRALLFGPLSPASFRLTGPDKLPDAAERVRQDAAEFGAIVSPEFRADESVQLKELEEWRVSRSASSTAA
jgi:cation diffusion facilitator CzcD-associated flavoprotein CzcO